jgi:ATP-binding cassette subfamily B (MDR/TAP) protein 1
MSTGDSPIIEEEAAIAVVPELNVDTVQQDPIFDEAQEAKKEKKSIKSLFKTKKKDEEKKSVENYTNEEDIKDEHEPIVKNGLKIFAIANWELIWLLPALFGAAGSGAVPILFFKIFGDLLNALTPSRNADGSFIPYPPGYSVYGETSYYCMWLAVLAGCSAVVSFIMQFFMNFASERFSARFKFYYFRAIVMQELTFFDIKKSGKLLASLAEDVQSIQEAMSMKICTFTQNFTQFIIGIILAFVASWQMSLLMLVCVPILAAIVGIFSKLMSIINKKTGDVAASAIQTANEVLGSIRTVRSMAGEEREMVRFGNDLTKIAFFAIGKAFTLGLVIGGFNFVMWGVCALAFWYGGLLVGRGIIGPGALIQVFGMMLVGVIGLSMALSEGQHFVKAHVSAMEILKVINRVPQIPIDSGKNLEKVIGNVEFRDVHFRYASRPKKVVLDKFNLTVQSGKHVALVGESGCGKSTITGLLERFYDPISGDIFLDGENLRNINPTSLHKHIAIVTQEPVLFATTIRKNITYAVGDDNVTDEQVYEAARAANAHDFIMKLPDKYSTLIGERGVSLSGGQKQRVAIARAVLQNAPMLILDEATSALDTEAESIVQDALDRLMVGRTTIVIAHRLSTVQDCDVIVVMDKGVLAEMGTHYELIQNKKGLYYKLAKKQMMFGMSAEERAQISPEEVDFAVTQETKEVVNNNQDTKLE